MIILGHFSGKIVWVFRYILGHFRNLCNFSKIKFLIHFLYSCLGWKRIPIGKGHWIRPLSCQWTFFWTCQCKSKSHWEKGLKLTEKKLLYFQFGNTCYSNSVLQALYFCKPFREKVLEYKAKNKKGKETLLSCLADLFYSIATQKKKVGTIAPKKFIARLRKEKVDFDNYMQQDAHEFLNFLINHINEIIVGESHRMLFLSKKNLKNIFNFVFYSWTKSSEWQTQQKFQCGFQQWP